MRCHHRPSLCLAILYSLSISMTQVEKYPVLRGQCVTGNTRHLERKVVLNSNTLGKMKGFLRQNTGFCVCFSAIVHVCVFACVCAVHVYLCANFSDSSSIRSTNFSTSGSWFGSVQVGMFYKLLGHQFPWPLPNLVRCLCNT